MVVAEAKENQSDALETYPPVRKPAWLSEQADHLAAGNRAIALSQAQKPTEEEIKGLFYWGADAKLPEPTIPLGIQNELEEAARVLNNRMTIDAAHLRETKYPLQPKPESPHGNWFRSVLQKIVGNH
jgi:hypothetical protein